MEKEMTKTNLWLDIGIFAGFLVAMNPALTGIAVGVLFIRHQPIFPSFSSDCILPSTGTT